MHYDIVIIGASTSGFYAAELLAREGLEVALFERETAIRPDRRTYIITPGLDRVIEDLPDELFRHRVNKIAVQAGPAVREIDLHEPDLILDRRDLTQHLGRRARQAGAAVFTGMEFQTFREEEEQTRLIFKDQEGQERVMSADAVIGADGAFSRVGREAGIAKPPTVPLLQAEVDLPPDWDPALTKVWFDLAKTRYFFWLIPESQSRGVVGMIGNPGSDVRGILNEFLDSLGAAADKFQSGQTAMHHPRLKPWREVGNTQVLLVGDAAGQVKVTTVGGTVTGLWGAQAAAEAVIEDKDYLDVIEPLERELDLHWWIRGLLERMDPSDYRKMVERLSPPVTSFLARHDRDAMKSQFWKLPFLQPLFVPLGLKLIFHPARYPTLIPESRSRSSQF